MEPISLVEFVVQALLGAALAWIAYHLLVDRDVFEDEHEAVQPEAEAGPAEDFDVHSEEREDRGSAIPVQPEGAPQSEPAAVV